MKLLPRFKSAGRSPMSRMARRPNHNNPLRLERLEDRDVPTAGAIDPTFGIGGMQLVDFGSPYNFPRDVALQGDKIIVVGSSDQGEGHYIDFAVTRLNADGSLDTSFNGTGKQLIDFSNWYDDCLAVAVAGDKIIVAGASASNGGASVDFGVARLNLDGSLDTTFNGTGKQLIDFDASFDVAYSVTVAGDKIIVAGYSESEAGGFAVARLNGDGTLDTSFNGTGRRTISFADDSFCTSVAVQGDKIVLAGTVHVDEAITTFEGDFALVRLNADGSLDTSFNGTGTAQIDLGSPRDAAWDVAVQGDKILVSGNYETFFFGLDPMPFAVLRLNNDGSLDTTFGSGGMRLIEFGNRSAFEPIMVLHDDKIILVGALNFDLGNGFAVARLTSDGSLDTCFGQGGKQIIDNMWSVYNFGAAVQTDGNIVLAGTKYVDNHDFAVVRLLGTNETATTLTAEDTTYTGHPYAGTLSITVTADGSDVSGAGTVSFTFFADAAGTTEIPRPTNAGTYYVQGFFTSEDSCYGDSQSAIVSFTIAPATPTITVTGGTFLYDGLGHPATASVTGVLGENLGPATITYVDSNGNPVPVPIEPGYYSAMASFGGNQNYTVGSATATITIAYDANVLTDLSKAFKAGRVIPIRLQILDAAGNNISSPNIPVTALRLARVNADGSRTPVTLQDAGNSNPGNLFRYDAGLGGYIFNLSTKGLGAGEYEFFWLMGPDPTEHRLTFRLV